MCKKLGRSRSCALRLLFKVTQTPFQRPHFIITCDTLDKSPNFSKTISSPESRGAAVPEA